MSSTSKDNPKTDRRIHRTQHSLNHALVQLMLEKNYDAITVQNLLDRANVGRSTFYTHYRDKEDLFLSGWESLLDGFIGHINWGCIYAGRCLPVFQLFHHLQHMHHFYRALAMSRKTDIIFKTGLSYLTQGIEKSLTTYLTDKPQPSISIAILAHNLASEVFSLLRWWLEHNMPHSPERMDAIYHDLVMPGFRFALQATPSGDSL